jgi:hypothetical protein
MVETISPEFLDIINFAICQAVNESLGEGAPKFFRRVGEIHLEEALRRGLIELDLDRKPLDNLIEVARYLESAGYMERISVNKLSEGDADVEMFGVSVTKSSVDILKAGKHPSHYMTNIMLATLGRLGVQAELRDVDFDEANRHFRERWKIIETKK